MLLFSIPVLLFLFIELAVSTYVNSSITFSDANMLSQPFSSVKWKRQGVCSLGPGGRLYLFFNCDLQK